MLRSPSKADVEHSSGWEGSGRLCDGVVSQLRAQRIYCRALGGSQTTDGVVMSQFKAGVWMTARTAAPSHSQASPSGCLVCSGSATYDLVHSAPLDFDVLEVLTADLLGNPCKARSSVATAAAGRFS